MLLIFRSLSTGFFALAPLPQILGALGLGKIRHANLMFQRGRLFLPNLAD
jgi:hypothetical protein